MKHLNVTDPAVFATAFAEALNAEDLDRLLRLYDPQAACERLTVPWVEASI